jgi:predicted DCC family thiol-disulfide oxidoreductase YuxK
MTQPGMTSPVESRPVRVTVWFDGDCPLCRREIALMRGLDRDQAVKFIDLAVEEPGVASPAGDRCAMLARLHAQEPGQPIVSGAAAFAAMWRAIPLLRPLGQLARRRAVLWLLERLYIGFLRIRPILQAAVRRLENGISRRDLTHGG